MGEVMQEEAKAEAKGEKKENEEKEEEEKASPPPPVILLVDMHCVGCAKKIERCIMKCRGVEGVEMDMVHNQVKIKGIVCPQTLCARIQKKTMREVMVVSPPLPPADGDSTKPLMVASEVSETKTLEVNVNMHCEGCAQTLRRKILKMRGVQAVETDGKAGKAIVTGTMDAEKLVEYIYRRTGKLARIIPPPPPKEEEKDEVGKKDEQGKDETTEEKKEEEKKGEEEKKEDAKEGEGTKEGGDPAVKTSFVNGENMASKFVYWSPVYIIERPPPPPQLFSDENPNACCIT